MGELIANIVVMISGAIVLICIIPIILTAIRAVRNRKNMTKQIFGKIYKTNVTCLIIILFSSFIGSVLTKILGAETTVNIFSVYLDALLTLLLKAWPALVLVYVLRRRLKNFKDE